MILAQFGGFRPDPSIAFHIMRPPAINGEIRDDGFIAFATHNSVGSTVYVYDNISGGGFMEAHKSDVYGGGAVPALFCYKYDPSNTATPVEKTCSIPDPGYMVVTDAAE